MSQSDQAFIRAYNEPRRVAPASRHSPAPMNQQTSLNDLYSGTVEMVGSFAGHRTAEPVTPTTTNKIPAPHSRFVQRQPAPVVNEPVEVESYDAGPFESPTAPSGKRWIRHDAHPQYAPTVDEEPVAGRIVATNRPTAAPVVNRQSPQSFRPAFEVEEFAWLPIIEHLCSRQYAGFDRVLLEWQENPAIHCRVLGLTSVKRGEGRTTLAQCLARRAIEQGLRVCLLDLDDGNPQLGEQLGLAVDTGWEHLLGAPRGIQEVTIESATDNLAAVLLRHPLAAGTIAKHAPQIRALINQLAAQYDLVLIDAAPPGDPLAKKQVQAALEFPAAGLGIERWLVIRDVRQTNPADLARWQRRLGNNIELIGVLENRAEVETAGHHG